MRLITWRHLADFAAAHPEAAPSLNRWRDLIRDGDWRTPAELTASFSGAKTVSADRVRFEVAGGAYRLIAAFDFGRQIAFVKFLGAHAEYDRIDAATVALF